MKKLSIPMVLAVPLAMLLMGLSMPAGADNEADKFNQEVRWAHWALQRGDIVTEAGGGQTAARGGAAGRRIEAQYGQEPSLDSGSRWFNDYVNQVNAQLRLSERADSTLP